MVQVTDDLMVFSRNATCGEIIAALLGVGLMLGSMIPITVVPIFVAITCTRFIGRAEEMLAVTYGDEYLACKARV